MQNDWNESTESERVAELQHRCPDLYRDLAKLEFSELPRRVQNRFPFAHRTYRGSFYEALSFRDEVICSGGRADQVRHCGTSFYIDWSPANG